MRKLRNYLFACACILVTVQILHAQDLKLDTGRPIEKEITGGQTHVYQISLTAGQFVRLRLDQKVLDATLILAAPDGKQLAEMNLTGAGEQEVLAFEAAGGTYKLTVRGVGTPKMAGSYRLEMTSQPAAGESDRKYLAAQDLLLESLELAKQNPKPPQLF